MMTRINHLKWICKMTLMGSLILLGMQFTFRLTPKNSDVPLRIVFTGDWKGDFIPKDGSGGLAALFSYVDDLKRDVVAQNGDLLFLYAGDLTAANSPEQFLKSVVYPQLNLLDYLGFDAILLGEKEYAWMSGYSAMQYKKHFQRSQVTVFNHRNLKQEASIGRPFRIRPVMDLNVMISSLANGKEPHVNTNPLPGLFMELNRQKGVDLLVLMMNQNSEQLKEEQGFESTKASSLNAPSLLESKQFYDFYVGAISQKTDFTSHSNSNPWIHKTLILMGGASNNHFYRHPAGPYICQTKPKNVCQINIKMRNKKIIEFYHEFVDINGLHSNHTRVFPDRLLYDTLK